MMVMERCRDHNITLSASKAQVGQEVKFAGFMVGSEGIKADPAKVEAIKEFPAPKDLTNLKSYLGLANQLGEFCPDLKQSLEPIKPLLSGKNAYAWNEELQKSFDKSKEVLCSCLLYTSPSPRDATLSRMPSSA